MKRTIKQFLGLLLVFMMAFSCITPAMAATSEVECLDSECPDHNHDIDEHVEDVHSTCGEEHCVASTSSISKAMAKKQAACNHTWTTVTTKQPTCGTSGTYVTKCSKCGAGSPNGNGYIPATGKHTWKVTSTTNATCTANGSKTYKCSVCGQTKTETINKLGHNWNRSAANCTTAKKCTRCGAVGQGALGHNWDRSAATCTADKKCTRCGSVGQAALGHNWDRSAATCTADKKCTRCGTVGQKATGHNYKQVTTKEPTCGASGTYVTKCTVCGAGAQNGNGYISPTGNHKWDRTAATCTADKKCTVCGTVGEAAKGHAWNLSAANCTTDMKCNRCGTINQKALGHNWDRSAATCTADKKCTRCGTVGQKATGHNYQQVTTKEPTCGTSGTYVTKCTVCGAGSQNGNGYISPTGNHSWNMNAATCTEDKVCTVCGCVGEKAKGHVREEVITQPTCSESGKYECYCKVCHVLINAYSIQSYGGHDWKLVPEKSDEKYCVYKCLNCKQDKSVIHRFDENIITPPSCTEEGWSKYTCQYCNYSYEAATPITPHDYEIHRNGNKVTCVCNDCGRNEKNLDAVSFFNVLFPNRNLAELDELETLHGHLLWMRYKMGEVSSLSDDDLLSLIQGYSFQATKSDLIIPNTQTTDRIGEFLDYLDLTAKIAETLEKGGKNFVFDKVDLAGPTEGLLWTLHNAGKMWGVVKLLDANMNGTWTDVYNAAVDLVGKFVPGGDILASAPVDIANNLAVLGEYYYKFIDDTDFYVCLGKVFGRTIVVNNNGSPECKEQIRRELASLTMYDFGDNPERTIADLLSEYALIYNYEDFMANPNNYSKDQRKKAMKVFNLYVGVLNNSLKTMRYDPYSFRFITTSRADNKSMAEFVMDAAMVVWYHQTYDGIED